MPKDTWERFARSRAEHYICTDIGSSTPEGRRAFFRSGQEYVDGIVADFDHILPKKRLALEFGCGVGRVAIAMASHFERVIAVDISPTMLDKLRANCEEFGVGNVTPCLLDDDWEAMGPFDLTNSFLVFQHLPSNAVVGSYLRRMAACLADHGICHVQFDSRPKTVPYRLRGVLPDVVLPDRWRSGIRRIRRSPSELQALVRQAGLQVTEERGAGTELHFICAMKP